MPRGHKTIILSDEQRKIAEENHNLIYSFARKKNLDIDEFYDLLAIGLCKAAYYFKPNKGKFSTIAYIRMQHEMYNYYKELNMEKRIPKEKIVHYDIFRTVGKNGDYSTDDVWSNKIIDSVITRGVDEQSIDKVFCDSAIKKISKLCTPLEKETLYYVLKGVKAADIGKKYNITRQAVQQRVKQIAKRSRKAGIL